MALERLLASMTHAAAILILVTGTSAGTFCGLLACAYLDWGFAFGSLKQDLFKCFMISALAIVPAWGLLLLSGHPLVVAPFPAVWFLSMRLSWLELEKPAIVLTGLATLLGIALAAVALTLFLGRLGV
jgi:hypothetical protein